MNTVPRIRPDVLQAARAVMAQAAQAGQCEPASERAVYNGLPYYSIGKMTATRSGAGPYTYTVAAGRKLRLFGYAIGDLMDAAGFAGQRAQDVDTNLTVAAQTNAGEDLTAYGIGFQVIAPGTGLLSDPALVMAALPGFTATIESQGRKGRVPVGPLDLIPGATGAYGAALSAATNASVGGFTNGQPINGNFLEIPGNLIWTSQGPDSQLVVIVDNARDVTFTTANAGPATVDFVFRVQLFCTQLSDSSQNG